MSASSLIRPQHLEREGDIMRKSQKARSQLRATTSYSPTRDDLKALATEVAATTKYINSLRKRQTTMSTTMSATAPALVTPTPMSPELTILINEYGYIAFHNTLEYDKTSYASLPDSPERSRFLSRFYNVLSDAQLFLYLGKTNAMPGLSEADVRYYLTSKARLIYENIPKPLFALERQSENKVVITRIASDITGLSANQRVEMRVIDPSIGIWRLAGIYQVAINMREKIPSKSPFRATLRTSEINRALRDVLTKPLKNGDSVDTNYKLKPV